MKSISNRSLVFVCIVAVSLSCNNDQTSCELCLSQPSQCNLTIEDAKVLFETDPYTEGSPQFESFQWGLGTVSLDWNQVFSVYDERNANDNLEVSFTSQYSIRFYQQGKHGQREYLDSDRRILLIKNRESQQFGAFVMYMIADEKYTRDHRRVELNRAFHNDGQYHDFSGLIVYTRLDGHIVRANRYQKGRLVTGVFIPGSNSWEERLFLLSQMRGMWNSICLSRIRPKLRLRSGSDSLENDPSWFEQDTLDPAICVADTVACDEWDPCEEDSGGVSGWGDWLPDGYWDDGENNNLDPGGGGGNNQGNQGEQGSTPQSNTTGRVVDSYEGLCIDAQNQAQIDEIKTQLEYCINKPIILTLKNNAVKKIIIDPSITSGAKASKSWSYIKVNPSADSAAVLEDLFHTVQFVRCPNWSRGNYEFEAKIWLAVLQIEYGVYFGFLDERINPFYQFYLTPNRETFTAAENALRLWGYSQSNYPISQVSDFAEYFKNVVYLKNSTNE